MSCPLKSCQNSCNCFAKYGLLGATIIFSLAIWALGLNHSIFFAINSRHNLLPDNVWQAINFIAYAKTFILPGLLLVLTLIFRREKFINVVILIASFYVLFYILKVAVHEARPFVVLPAESFYWLHGEQNAVKDMYHSFPSGHAGNAVIFAFALMRLFCNNSKLAKVALFLIPVVVAIARIATGWHWPLDVLASGIIGYILVQICISDKRRD